ncbi:MAG TPA: hypothetical protein ENH84_02505 [Phycisphaerae bacterium]|nr:hypothetical protein [Phycisphaerae bacterium]
MAKTNKIIGKKRVETPMSRMAKVASAVEIFNVQFVAFGAHREIELGSHEIYVEYAWKTHASRVSEAKQISVIVEFTMSAAPKDCVDKKKPIQVKAVLELVYNCEKVSSFDDRAIKDFGEINGVYNAWPYWREFVQNTVVRMGLPPLIVPTFRVLQPKTSKKMSRPARKRVSTVRKKTGSKVS